MPTTIRRYTNRNWREVMDRPRPSTVIVPCHQYLIFDPYYQKLLEVQEVTDPRIVEETLVYSALAGLECGKRKDLY